MILENIGFFLLANNLSCEYERMFERNELLKIECFPSKVAWSQDNSPSIDQAAATSNVLLVFQLNPEVETNILYIKIFSTASPQHH